MAIKLLIVDDSDPVRASLRGLLSRVQNITQIEEAATLTEALQCVRRDAPHLMVLDLHLPDGLGTQIIGTLRQLAPSMQIAVLTIHAEQSFRQECLSLGVDWFFDKTSEFEKLISVVCLLSELN